MKKNSLPNVFIYKLSKLIFGDYKKNVIINSKGFTSCNIKYNLLDGNKVQKSAHKAITKLNILEILSKYSPILVGTIPNEIDIVGSDLDIICEIYEFNYFKSIVFENFSEYERYVYKEKICNGEFVITVNFAFMGFKYEIYAKSTSTCSFNSYKHMIMEHMILALLDDDFRESIIDLKHNGLKTEPSFVNLLGLKGDPYEELLKLIDYSDEQIINMSTNVKTFT